MTRREFLAATAVAGIPAVVEALPQPEVKGLTLAEVLDVVGKTHRYVQRAGWNQKHLAWLMNFDGPEWRGILRPVRLIEGDRGFAFEVRDRFMTPCERICLDDNDKAATDWRVIEAGELDTSGDHEKMSYHEAGMCLRMNRYVQRAGWMRNTRHLALIGGKNIAINEHRRCYNEYEEWVDYQKDISANDWRTVSIQKTQIWSSAG